MEALKAEEPLTLFASTDGAVAKLPEGTLDSLLKPENKAELITALRCHVVPGKLMAADIVKARHVATLQGAGSYVRSRDDGVFLAEAKFVKTHIAVSKP